MYFEYIDIWIRNILVQDVLFIIFIFYLQTSERIEPQISSGMVPTIREFFIVNIIKMQFPFNPCKWTRLNLHLSGINLVTREH